MATEVSERRWLTLIFALFFLLGVGYSLLIPIWEAPDEPAHYHLAWRLARKGEYANEEINYEANQPRTFYYLGSFVIRALDKVQTKYSDYVIPREYKYNIRVPERRFDWNDGNYRFLLGVYALRWMNLLFGALALWFNWKTFKLIAPDKPALQLSALALAALTPQYLHIMSSVNNDAFGTLAGALLFYLAIRSVNQPSPLLYAACIPLAVILPLTTKLSVLPVGAAVLTIVVWKWLSRLEQRRWLAVPVVLFLSGAGLFYFLFPEMIQTALGEISWRLFTLRKKGVDMEYLQTTASQIIWTYWGKVGWLAVGLSWWVIDLLAVAGVIGIAIRIRTLIKLKGSHPQFTAWLATLLVAFITILAVARNGLSTGATQGRLLFPAIGALSLLMISGWHDMLPEKFQRNLLLFVTILMVMLTIGLWVFGIIPVYYQPFFD
jgi:hypothetical protein